VSEGRWDRALRWSWIVAWVALCTWILIAAPGWCAWVSASGLELSWFEELTLEIGYSPATVPLLAIALAIGQAPRASTHDVLATRLWYGLGPLQALALAIFLERLFVAPQAPTFWRTTPGSLSPCGNIKYTVPLIIVTWVITPLVVLQGLAWARLSEQTWRSPRSELGVELLRAAMIAALPCAVLAWFFLSGGAPRIRMPQWILVPRPVALSITASGLIFGAVLWVRLRRGPDEAGGVA
jgi:hypothetical protein